MPHLLLENSFNGPVCGVDEVGRGAWAGQVLACAAALKEQTVPTELLNNIDDCKKLTSKKRQSLACQIKRHFYLSLGRADVEEIDSLNIANATMLAMKRAIESMPVAPVVALIDGNRAPSVPIPCKTVIKGDGISLSIAAASIIAKVARDAHMAKLATQYPHYGWERNAGYGTKIHRQALKDHGVTQYHRKSYAPIKIYLAKK